MGSRFPPWHLRPPAEHPHAFHCSPHPNQRFLTEPQRRPGLDRPAVAFRPAVPRDHVRSEPSTPTSASCTSPGSPSPSRPAATSAAPGASTTTNGSPTTASAGPAGSSSPGRRSSCGRPGGPVRSIRRRGRRAPAACPECGGRSIPIGYGLPGPDMFGAAERGELHIGGCTPDLRRWHCTGCEAKFFPRPLRPSAGLGLSPQIQCQGLLSDGEGLAGALVAVPRPPRPRWRAASGARCFSRQASILTWQIQLPGHPEPVGHPGEQFAEAVVADGHEEHAAVGQCRRVPFQFGSRRAVDPQ